LYHACGRETYRTAAIKNLDWALSQQRENGWFDSASFAPGIAPLTHTIGYAVEGMLEAGALLNEEKYVSSALQSARALLGLQRSDGSLAGTYGPDWQASVQWSCLVGNAQIAIIWLRIFKLTNEQAYQGALNRITIFLASCLDMTAKDPGIRGGISGSQPIYGGYLPFTYPNWAAKFMADLLVLQTHNPNAGG
jgi:hypothetical protein